MNWDALGAISEFVAALGVIGSLVYVGYQLRQNTISTNRSNARQSAGDHARALLGIQDDTVAAIFFRGIEDLDSLTPLEQYRFDLAMAVWLEAIEQAFADYEANIYPEDFIYVHRTRVPAILNSPGGAAWWQRRKVWYSDHFQKVVNDLCSNPPVGTENAEIRTPSNKAFEADT